MRFRRLVNDVRSSLWFVPVVCVVAGAILSFGSIWIDQAFDFSLVSERLTGGPDAAVAILSTIAASMVSLAALVLTITMVVVQLAMGQFSPRIVQTFLRDKPSQFAIGLFIATFVHAMLALREVQFGSGGSVPGVAIVVAYLLVVASVVVLVSYVHHIGESLRVSALIELVGSDTRRVLDAEYSERLQSDEAQRTNVVAAPTSGVVTRIDHDELISIAEAANSTLEMLTPLGTFVPAGCPLVKAADAVTLPVERVNDAIQMGLERTLDKDVAYGMRMLVDVAERALSDSPFVDPTTAVQAIDRLHDCLRQLAQREFPDGLYRDRTGQVRLIVPVMDWDAYVHLAFDEIRLAGARSPQVTRRLVAALSDLESAVPPSRLPAIREQQRLLVDAVTDARDNSDDRAFALTPDRQGIGVTAGAECAGDAAPSAAAG
jgi:uncharacterized membrane protein